MASLSHVSFTKVYLVHNHPDSIIKTLHHPKNVVFIGRSFNKYCEKNVSINSRDRFLSVSIDDAVTQLEQFITSEVEMYEKVCMSK